MTLQIPAEAARELRKNKEKMCGCYSRSTQDLPTLSPADSVSVWEFEEGLEGADYDLTVESMR